MEAQRDSPLPTVQLRAGGKQATQTLAMGPKEAWPRREKEDLAR